MVLWCGLLQAIQEGKVSLVTFRQIGAGSRHQASGSELFRELAVEETPSDLGLPSSFVTPSKEEDLEAAESERAQSWSASLALMLLAACCMWSRQLVEILASVTSSSGCSMLSVTSTWMPTRNQSSWPVTGFLATVSPRMSSNLTKSSPVLRRFVSTPVKGAPVSQASLSRLWSSGSIAQPSLRKRELLPKTSVWPYPVMARN
mmetsp:Transcript_46121/g.83131  ORF Transcript_46121/g.83131 Transcript_46121/m.83131 type:complete len:203 (+) Transcript_46121:562-1170(+)